MTYIDGFVIAVPKTNKQKFIEHANHIDSMFIDYGATRVVECWENNVPKGKHTDFFGAVQSTVDESVAFAWIEWPDKETRDTAMSRVNDPNNVDSRADTTLGAMPFDGKRMIYGGFCPIVERGAGRHGSYVQGFLLASTEAKKEAYRTMAEDAWPMFQEFGALRLMEGWQDDVPRGKQTDFYRAVKAEPGESVLFSLIEWPSRESCDEAHQRMQTDERMKNVPADMPFDGKRMIYGGFSPVVELGA